MNKQNAATQIKSAQESAVEAEYQADGFNFDVMIQEVLGLSPTLILHGEEEDLKSEQEELTETLASVVEMAEQIESMAQVIREMKAALEGATAALSEG